MFPNAATILIGVVLLTIQSTRLCPDLFGLAGPDLFICLVAYLGMHRDIRSGAIPLVICGLLADVYSSTPIGLHMVAAVIVFLLLQLLQLRLVVRELVTGVVLVTISSWISSIVIWALASIFISSFEGGGSLFRFALMRSLITAPVAVPILWILEKLDGWGSQTRKRTPLHLSAKPVLWKS